MHPNHTSSSSVAARHAGRSIIERVRERFRSTFSEQYPAHVPKAERKAFVAALVDEGFGRQRYVERAVDLLNLPDEVLAHHIEGRLSFDELERLNRTGRIRRHEIVAELRNGVSPRSIPELQQPAVPPETALRQLVNHFERRQASIAQFEGRLPTMLDHSLKAMRKCLQAVQRQCRRHQ